MATVAQKSRSRNRGERQMHERLLRNSRGVSRAGQGGQSRDRMPCYNGNDAAGAGDSAVTAGEPTPGGEEQNDSDSDLHTSIPTSPSFTGSPNKNLRRGKRGANLFDKWIIIDEFSSVVDRATAKSQITLPALSYSFRPLQYILALVNCETPCLQMVNPCSSFSRCILSHAHESNNTHDLKV